MREQRQAPYFFFFFFTTIRVAALTDRPRSFFFYGDIYLRPKYCMSLRRHRTSSRIKLYLYIYLVADK